MYMRIDGALRDQLSALVRLQSETGLWHTLLTNPTSNIETSASAGIAAALAINGHPLHQKYVYKAFKGIQEQIAPDGTIKNVSAGTGVMATADDYKNVPQKRIQGWGQGLTLTFLAALIEYKVIHNR
jgi:unsaturated rhamnogalacturonyl hydrolase